MDWWLLFTSFLRVLGVLAVIVGFIWFALYIEDEYDFPAPLLGVIVALACMLTLGTYAVRQSNRPEPPAEAPHQ